MSGDVKNTKRIVDEFGDLSMEIQRMKPVVARHRALKEQIEEMVSDEPANLPLVIEGGRYDIQASAREWKRTIRDLVKVFRLLGKETFLRFCTFPLKGVDANFTAAEQEKLVLRERTGPRDLVAVPRPVPSVMSGRKAA